MAEKAVWEVIGGKDKGGIVVREEQSLKSKELKERLSFASLVEQIDLVGKRLHYKLLTGTGPDTGWVSINLADKDLLSCILKPPPRPPLFCAWYSGGFSVKDGEKQLEKLMEAVRASGVADAAIFHFPDGYGLEGEGRKPWAKYIDRVIDEINEVAQDEEQPLILFGHSRGASPAVCVATRLGSRVKHVYIAACGAMREGQATAWENLSLSFKGAGDRELLTWFSSLQPENVVLRRVAIETTDEEFVEQVKGSKFLSQMLSLMRHQYRDAMYPDPERDFRAFPANITAFAPLLDEGSQPEHLQDWAAMTLGKFQNVSLNAGHMDCIAPDPKGKCELFDFLRKDLKQYIK